MTDKNVTVALAGNPNCGKTTIFNNITGSRHHVGNYPGVTVERREGLCRHKDRDLLFIDLPGTYSLTAHSMDELVARNVIINERPDIIVNVLDASNLERNFYLAVQLLELERPAMLVLNMIDVADGKGLTINDEKLRNMLGVTVVRAVGNKNHGTADIIQAAADMTKVCKYQPFSLDYGPIFEEKIQRICGALEELTLVKYPLRWLAVKLLENDPDVVAALNEFEGNEKIMALVSRARAELMLEYGDDLDLVIAEKRYAFADYVYREVVCMDHDMEQTRSDNIDRILTHRVLGLPIFLGIMWLLFNFVFTVGAYPQEWLETGFAKLGTWVGQNMADGELKSLIAEGIIGGVGGVLAFLPNILLLFFGIALLEDTGYMTRAAFVVDRIMRAVGLHGRSFIPLLIGFGCTVPAIMGARILENPRDRIVTMLVAPFMSCSARLPVYTLLSAAFFAPEIAGTVMFSIYIIGIVMAIVMAMLFRKYLFPGEAESFVMEMPPYHIPTLRSILIHMWERSVLYLKKAGTLILAASILIWFATNYPADVKFSKDFEQAQTEVAAVFDAKTVAVIEALNINKIEDNTVLSGLIKEIGAINEAKDAKGAKDNPLAAAEAERKLAALEKINPALFAVANECYEIDEEKKEALGAIKKEEAGEKLAGSYAGQIGKAIEPVIKPLGFDWKMGVGLFSAMAAKEVMVSTLGTIYKVGEVDEDDTLTMQEALKDDGAFTPLVAYCLMLFTLMYSPCIASLAVLKRETNSWKWPAFTFVYTTVLAWVITFVVYQVGSRYFV